ncbi:MAG: glycosyltransferase family 2 protein [Xanthomonadales bacterium]|nr:glycosyltransferase family 2 protein [Xanthomonadales bacterium]
MNAERDTGEPLSVFITTYNNGGTLARCLDSVAWASDIVVLDSFSKDDTLDIARRYDQCRVEQATFAGYGPQKQAALELTRHRWVLLLDADEALTARAQERIQALLHTGPQANGYRLPRIEQMFWRMQSESSRLNTFLRLFDKRHGRISDMPVHAAPEVEAPVEELDAPFLHFGEVDIHTKVDKINHYSTGLVEDKARRRQGLVRTRMLLYPPFAFLRSYLFKRQFVNGWAGFIASVVTAFYAFLKYAKLYEQRQDGDRGEDQSELP